MYGKHKEETEQPLPPIPLQLRIYTLQPPNPTSSIHSSLLPAELLIE